MANNTLEKGVTLEVLGTCMTNTTLGSTHVATVEYRHLWSYAQQAALIAVSDKNPNTGCYELITDPERRAKRIAAHYADLYFKSGEKSNGKVNFHWPALASFVVKDIVEAYRFSREEVLHRKWNDKASVARNNTIADLVSMGLTDNSPYEHVLRTYAALAKGNLWLFMDIYPWLWFFIEYGINADGTLNQKRLDACLPERDWSRLQSASKEAVEELPFGPNWTKRLAARLRGDTVFERGRSFFQTPPAWTVNQGYGQHTAAAHSAHIYCKLNAKQYDSGYRMPSGKYWGDFPEAFYVMESEHRELTSVIQDKAGMNALVLIREFSVTPEIREAFAQLQAQYKSENKYARASSKAAKLKVTAKHEQLNVLQPLIYDDPRLKITMDMNHSFSRFTSGWISPQFKVVYNFNPKTSDPALQSVFDPATGLDRFFGENESLTDPTDRMKFVAKIAKNFSFIMETRPSYMEAEMRKIRGWLKA